MSVINFDEAKSRKDRKKYDAQVEKHGLIILKLLYMRFNRFPAIYVGLVALGSSLAIIENSLNDGGLSPEESSNIKKLLAQDLKSFIQQLEGQKGE